MHSDEEDERSFRLRPRKPPRSRKDNTAVAFVSILYHAKLARRTLRSPGNNSKRHLHRQRCAVRVLYSRSTTPGLWRAHGRYIARESARTIINSAGGEGSDATREKIDIANRLDAWQNAGDERLWKFIISPEFGDRLNMEKLTRELMIEIERQLQTKSEWVAVTHNNTDHRHTHIALRGVDGRGQQLLLDRQFIQHGIREIAKIFVLGNWDFARWLMLGRHRKGRFHNTGSPR